MGVCIDYTLYIVEIKNYLVKKETREKAIIDTLRAGRKSLLTKGLRQALLDRYWLGFSMDKKPPDDFAL